MNPKVLKAYKNGVLYWAFRLVYILFQYDKDLEVFYLTTSKRRFWLYYFKTAFHFFYCSYQFCNATRLNLQWFNDTSVITNSFIIDMFWFYTSAFSLWYHIIFLLKQHSVLSCLNTFLNLPAIPDPEVARQESWSFKWAKAMIVPYNLFWYSPVFSNTLILSVLFIGDPTKKRYMFSLLPVWFQEQLWAKIVFYIFETYLLCSTFFNYVLAINMPCIYTFQTTDRLVLAKIKYEEVIDKDPSKIDQARSEALNSFHVLRVLNAWYNSDYKFGKLCIHWCNACHIMWSYCSIRLHSSLPLPTLSLFSFWSVAAFPFIASFIIIMTDLQVESTKFLKKVKAGMKWKERRRFKYLRPIGFNLGRSLAQNNSAALYNVFLVCRLTKSLLVLV